MRLTLFPHPCDPIDRTIKVPDPENTGDEYLLSTAMRIHIKDLSPELVMYGSAIMLADRVSVPGLDNYSVHGAYCHTPLDTHRLYRMNLFTSLLTQGRRENRNNSRDRRGYKFWYAMMFVLWKYTKHTTADLKWKYGYVPGYSRDHWGYFVLASVKHPMTVISNVDHDFLGTGDFAGLLEDMLSPFGRTEYIYFICDDVNMHSRPEVFKSTDSVIRIIDDFPITLVSTDVFDHMPQLLDADPSIFNN